MCSKRQNLCNRSQTKSDIGENPGNKLAQYVFWIGKNEKKNTHWQMHYSASHCRL